MIYINNGNIKIIIVVMIIIRRRRGWWMREERGSIEKHCTNSTRYI